MLTVFEVSSAKLTLVLLSPVGSKFWLSEDAVIEVVQLRVESTSAISMVIAGGLIGSSFTSRFVIEVMVGVSFTLFTLILNAAESVAPELSVSNIEMFAVPKSSAAGVNVTVQVELPGAVLMLSATGFASPVVLLETERVEQLILLSS